MKKLRFHVCINEMASFEALAAVRTVALMTGMVQREVYPRDEMANPPGMKVLTVDRHELRWRLQVVSYSVCCAITAARTCSESCVRVWSASGSDTGRYAVF